LNPQAAGLRLRVGVVRVKRQRILERRQLVGWVVHHRAQPQPGGLQLVVVFHDLQQQFAPPDPVAAPDRPNGVLQSSLQGFAFHKPRLYSQVGQRGIIPAPLRKTVILSQE
jgi:hypothetical protein